MPERRGSGRNIQYWQAKCQREDCGHPRAKHFVGHTIGCSSIVYNYEECREGCSHSSIDRCQCTGFQEVKD